MGNDTGALPDWIDEPVRIALGDLQEPGASPLALEWTPEGDDAGVLVVSEPVDASKRFENDELVPADLLVDVAGWLQDRLVADPAGSPADGRPVCPGHDHAMEAKSLYDVAWWVCPATDSPIRLIGDR